MWLMRAAGPLWWLWAWAAWIAFQFLMLALYPTVIAPLFNKFSPLPAGAARDAIEALLARCGFANRGLFVMDGSRRSSHGNAFFTGFGRAKRIVFFDTLLERLTPDEVEAVLAHELGHFKLKHVLKRMLWMAASSLAFLGAARVARRVAVVLRRPGRAAGAWTAPASRSILFFLALPVFTFVLAPLASLYSRRHEFEADAFAAQHASAASLVRALVKLYEDNASTLTPDPLYSAFHDSHPPAALRIARLEALALEAPCRCRPHEAGAQRARHAALALASMHCRDGAPRLGADELAAHARRTAGLDSARGRIEKAFRFANYTRDDGLRQRAGLDRPSRRPPSRLQRPLQPLRGRGHDAQRRRRHAERRHLRGQGGTPLA